MDRNSYIQWAEEALEELADMEHAFVRTEAFARISDVLWDGIPKTVDPDLVSIAINGLKEEGLLDETRARTRGGRNVSVLHLADLSGRKTAFEAAAKRKRLLLSRYLGWAHGTPGSPGIIGPAGEKVLRESLKEARKSTPMHLENDGREVAHMFGAPVRGGPLDAAVHLLVMELGKPVPVTLPIEVKNIRGWIFPWSRELFQLLHKAALPTD